MIRSATTTYSLDIAGGLTQVLAAQSAEDGTYTYLYGLDRIAQNSANGIEYFLPDVLGNVRNLTTANGTVTLTRSYEPFGSVQASVGLSTTNYGFAGEWTDPTGLQNLRARYYAPELGRFLTRDPYRGTPWQPASLNIYSYGLNNPLKYTDPSGHCIWDGCIVEAMVVGAVVSVAVDAFVTTQIEHKEYTWQRGLVAAGAGALSGGIGAAVIAPLAAATGTIAALTFTGVAGQATRAAVATGTELVMGTVLSAEANIFISSAQRTANQALDGKAVSLDTYKANIQENMWTDAGFGALGYGLGSSIGKGISSTFPIRPSNGPIPGWNNNLVQKIFIGTGQAGGMAVSNSTLLDCLFKPLLLQPQPYQSGYRPVNGF